MLSEVNDQTNKLLNLVSRSFALCIPMLPEKVKQNVANFYLLCRYADSIEDSTLSQRRKNIFFKKYLDCVKREKIKEVKELSEKILPFVISHNDKEMVCVFESVIKEYSLFDKKTKNISLKWLTKMVLGMKKYSRKEISDFSDLNNYCYFVAGTVGMCLTDLFVYKFELKEQHPELLKRAKDFGLLLQKVNIIRDFSKDYAEGRLFWPKKLFDKYGVSVKEILEPKNSENRKLILKEMVESAKTNMQNSIEYLTLLPKGKEYVGLRVFCAIPLFMAMPTLIKCDDNEKIFVVGEKVKISRTQTVTIINSIKNNIENDEFISNYYNNAKNQLG